MERYGFRDEWISGLHREFGKECRMMDIDFLAIEYLGNKPTALVEYKYACDVDAFKTHGAVVMNNLADHLPTFLVIYKHAYEGWKVYSLNDMALGFLGTDCKDMTAYDYALFLNYIRGVNLTEENQRNIFENIQSYISNNQIKANEIERNFNEHQQSNYQR